MKSLGDALCVKYERKHAKMDAILEDLPLPDMSKTELLISYTYSAEDTQDDGSLQVASLHLKGEEAEHGPYMLQKFQEFLDKCGFKLNIEPPVTVTRLLKVAAAVAICLLVHGVQPPRRHAVHRLNVVANIPIPTASA